MTRDQQGVLLFLSLSLVLFFFLTYPPSGWNRAGRLAPEEDISPRNSPAGEVTVEVDGSVNRRGVYSIPAGMTVLDLIEKAGGMSAKISLPPESLLNKIEKSCRLSVLPDGEEKGRVTLEPMAPNKLKILFLPVDLNTASIEELDTLPGIGPKTAQAVVEYRETHGPFASPEDLLQVPGIGPKKLAAILGHITVQGRP
jgi:competence protein ComEA